MKNEIITPGLLHCDKYRTMWLYWAEGLIELAIGSPSEVWLSWQDPDPTPVNAMGFDTSDDMAGDWEIIKLTGNFLTLVCDKPINLQSIIIQSFYLDVYFAVYSFYRLVFLCSI